MKRNNSKSKIKNKGGGSGKIPLINRIGFKISIFFTCGILAVGLSIVLYMAYNANLLVQKANVARSDSALVTMESIFDQYKSDSVKAAEYIARNEAVIQSVASGAAYNVKAAVTEAEKQIGLNVDFVTITNSSGIVIARTHSDKTGDIVTNQKNVSQALAGKTTTQTDLGTEIKLSIRTGAPVKDAKGNIIGVISTGYSMVKPEFVDKMKNMTGNEFTVFIGDERVNTTVMTNGQRAVGTKLDPAIAKTVLVDHNVYKGETKIVGSAHTAIYKPLINGEGEVIGILFAGIPIGELKAALLRTYETSAVIVFLIIILVAVLLTVFLRKAVSAPLLKMAQIATELSRGNLDLDLHHKSKDEFGVMANALQATISSLKSYIQDISDKLDQMSKGNMCVEVNLEYVGDFIAIREAILKIALNLNESMIMIRSAAEQVDTGAEQVSALAQALASGSTEQAATVEELSASISDVAKQAEQNVLGVKEAADYVGQAVHSLNSGNAYMEKLTNAMKEISDNSMKVSGITKLVEEIAFQTNILALNAAIEAARAGEAGKGFSVVADEVRVLAARSAEAAKQAEEIIERTVGAVNDGNKITGETALILHGVAEKSRLIEKAIGEVEANSTAQTASLEQINFGLTQVSAVVQTNAASAEESSASSEELAAQAQVLKQEILKFKLNEKAAF